MATTSESVIQTVVKTIKHSDFQTVASSATQTVPILVPSSSDTTAILVRNVTVFVKEAWPATAPAISIGKDGSTALFSASLSGSTVNQYATQGSAYISPAITVTTVGANTGTPGAGLSLIGNTTSVNQASNLMNDLEALRADISTIADLIPEIRLTGSEPQLFTSGDGVKATLTLGAGTWESKTAGEFTVVVEYIDISSL